MKKTLMVNGCSYGACWNPSMNFIKGLGMDDYINISKSGTSFQRTARSTIEWIAQNGSPDYIFIPITYCHRWELALSSEQDPIDGSWVPLQNSNYLSDDYNLQDININDLRALVERYYGIIPNIKTYWDKMFTEIIMLSAFLDVNRIPYLMWDMCNGFDTKHIKGYKGFDKINIIKQNPRILDLWTFCGNRSMWGSMDAEQKKKTDKYTYHHAKDQYLHLENLILEHINTNKL